jgi:sugar lactone lactonase YvrE
MKKILLLTVVLFAAVVLSRRAVAQQHQLVKLWQTDTILKTPESVLYNEKGKYLFVSNIDGQPWEKDGKGSIGKIGLDGKIINVEWVKGLDAPKGMGMYNNILYVADVDNVVVIDIAKESIVKRIPVDSATGLNDVSVDRKGTVYVTDSKSGKIYSIQHDKASLFTDGLKGLNGVLAVGTDVYALASGSLYKISPDKKVAKQAEGMEPATDGVEQVSENEFIVSVWNGVIYYVKGNAVQQMLDTREQKSNTADIGYDNKNKIVYVPTFFKNGVVAYQLK